MPRPQRGMLEGGMQEEDWDAMPQSWMPMMDMGGSNTLQGLWYGHYDWACGPCGRA